MMIDQTLLAEYPLEAPAAPARIARRAGLSVAEFRRTHVVPRIPVVLTDAAREWPIYGRGTPEYFRRVHGDRPVRVLGRTCRLAELIERLERSTVENPAPYPCKFEIAKEFRELLPEVSPRFAHSLPDRQTSALVPQRLFAGVNNLEIFFGGAGGRFPYLHYDVMHLHAWITQLYGEKEFVLYAPGQEQFLYPRPDLPWQSSIRNHHAPDYARYPLLLNARAQKIVLRPGETLFLPCGWWHTARSLGVTISIAFDQLGPDNWDDFRNDVVAERRNAGHAIKASLLDTYLRVVDVALAIGERFGAGRRATWGTR